MRCLVVSLLLAGCSTFTTKPYNERVTESTVVKWITVDNVEEECVKLGANKPPLMSVLGGCAVYNKHSCTIYTEKTTSMEILGHELRHCFEGKFHK